MSWVKEFKQFALRGNFVDLAIGVIIGAAFGKVVSSLVSDVLMPPLGLLLGGVDFSDLSLEIKKASATEPSVAIKYGVFLNSLVDFFIVAFTIFAVIKIMNRLQLQMQGDPRNKDCPECRMSIPTKATRCGHCCIALPPNEKDDDNGFSWSI